MIVKYLDGDYQHVVARVRDGQCVSKYNNMVMSDIFWRITRHVNIPPLATRAPTLRLWTRRASVLHFRRFFFFLPQLPFHVCRKFLARLSASLQPRSLFYAHDHLSPAAYLMVVISRQIHLQELL